MLDFLLMLGVSAVTGLLLLAVLGLGRLAGRGR
jgi:hypothetical protein